MLYTYSCKIMGQHREHSLSRMLAPVLPPWLARVTTASAVAGGCIVIAKQAWVTWFSGTVFALSGVLVVIHRIGQGRVTRESILVLKEIGVQLRTEYADGTEDYQFVDMQRIKAVIINEGITMHRVIFYLAFVVKGQDRLIIAFKNLQPRLEQLLPIWRNLLEVIFREVTPDDRCFDAGRGATAAEG